MVLVTCEFAIKRRQRRKSLAPSFFPPRLQAAGTLTLPGGLWLKERDCIFKIEFAMNVRRRDRCHLHGCFCGNQAAHGGVYTPLMEKK
jgi:hypothetical protein